MTIVGVTGTTNEKTAFTDIGALWAKAAAAGVFGTDANAYAVYHNYQVRPGGYTCSVTIGRKVETSDVSMASKKELVSVLVPAQTCEVVATDGSIPSVQKAWGDLWSRWPDGGPRTFAADFEHWKMGPAGQPQSADIYIGVQA
jgi:predicted transcriptional regulator YdeE